MICINLFLATAALVAQPFQLQQSIVGDGQATGLDSTIDPEEYLVGPGDVIMVVVEGGCTPYMISAGLSPIGSYTVSNDGILAVSGIGQLMADGLTLSGLQYELSTLARSSYPRANIGVSLSSARPVRVRASGTFMFPGEYSLTSVDRVSALVKAAGSFSSYSSRIGRMLIDDASEVEVNLLIDPETGRPFSDPYLTNGAVVEFSPCIDPVYVLYGNRSGLGAMDGSAGDPVTLHSLETWDLVEPRDVESFIGRMGGVQGNVDLGRSGVLRNGDWIALWSEGQGYESIELATGDTLWLERLTEIVVVSGAVAQPGPYPYDASLTVGEYIGIAGGGLSSAHLGGTKITRDGEEVDLGSGVLSLHAQRGDVIEVPYSWVARNGAWISLIASLVSVAVLIDNAVSN